MRFVEPIVRFGPLDWAIVLVFAALLLALGFSAKLRDHSILQFLAAGRKLTLPVFVATLVSMWYGGILGVGETVASFGLGSLVLIGAPYYVFAVLYALVFAKRIRGAEQLSLPERLEHRFGKSVALVGAALVFLLAVPAAHVLMLGVLVRSFTGWPIILSIVVATLGGTAFLYKGGLLADARASLLAFVMMYVGFGVMVGQCLTHHPIVPTMASLANKALLTWDGGMGVPFVLSFFILGAWTLVDPGFHQRVASATSPEVGRKGVLVSVGFWVLFDLLSITTGMYALALLPEAPADKLAIFPILGNQILPSGLKAVFFCGMLGTILSAMVGYTLVSGATIGREIVCRIKSGATDEEATRWSRVGIAAGCLAAIALASLIESVVQLWYSWSGAVIGALLVPVCLAYELGGRFRASSSAALASMLAAFAASVGWLVYGKTTGNDYLAVTLSNGDQVRIGTLLPGLAVSVAVFGLFGAWDKRSSSGRETERMIEKPDERRT